MLSRRAFLRGAFALVAGPHRTAAGPDTAQPAVPTPRKSGTPATPANGPAGRRSNALVFTVAA